MLKPSLEPSLGAEKNTRSDFFADAWRRNKIDQ